MNTYLPEFLLFASAHIFSLISPGPDFLMVVQSSLRYCRKTALWVAFGISCGELVHVSYSLLGIGVLISKSLWMFLVLKWLGACYLIYIGIMSLRSKKENAPKNVLATVFSHHSLTVSKAFGRGFLTNALNAKAAFFTLSFFTVLVSPQTPFYIQIFYGIFVQITTMVWFSIVALFLTNRAVRDRFLGSKHWIERICGLVLIVLGVNLGFSEFAL